jgi:hypothetical protein
MTTLSDIALPVTPDLTRGLATDAPAADEAPELPEAAYFEPSAEDAAWAVRELNADATDFTVEGEVDWSDPFFYTESAMSYWQEFLDPDAAEEAEAQARYEAGLLF